MTWNTVGTFNLPLNQWEYTPPINGEVFRFRSLTKEYFPVNVRSIQFSESIEYAGNLFLLITSEARIVKLPRPAQFQAERRLGLRVPESSLVKGDFVSVLVEVEAQSSTESPSPDQEAEADSELTKGQPLYLKSNGHVGLAQANDVATAQVCGLAARYAPAGMSVSFLSDGFIERFDWTLITGAELLAPGAYYYLSPLSAGMLTTIPPISEGAIVAAIGQALTPTRLQIEIQPSILL